MSNVKREGDTMDVDMVPDVTVQPRRPRIRPDLKDLMGDEAGLGARQPYRPGTPLMYCIEQFGGLLAFARAIGRSTRQLYRWRNQGGMISAEAQTEALIAAKRLGIEIDPVKLVYMPPVETE
jgi:hypothetical protein